MSNISDWSDLMTQDVTVAPFVSRDAYGTPTYGSGVSYKARVNYEQHLVRTADGEQTVARGTAWLARTTAVGSQDKVTLPDASTPLILVTILEVDEGGPLYCRLDFS